MTTTCPDHEATRFTSEDELVGHRVAWHPFDRPMDSTEPKAVEPLNPRPGARATEGGTDAPSA
jgi:hypothetical protein